MENNCKVCVELTNEEYQAIYETWDKAKPFKNMIDKTESIIVTRLALQKETLKAEMLKALDGKLETIYRNIYYKAQEDCINCQLPCQAETADDEDERCVLNYLRLSKEYEKETITEVKKILEGL